MCSRPAGTKASTSIRAGSFPYPDGSFDFAIATSVFTHLMPDDVSHYLQEIARVLDRGGTLFATFFIVDEFAVSKIRAGHTRWLREERPDGLWVHDPAKPEIAVGYTPEWIEKKMLEADLAIDTIRFGSWSGRDAAVNLQDILIASARGR